MNPELYEPSLGFIGSCRWGLQGSFKGSMGSIGFRVWGVVRNGVISRVAILITHIGGD